MTNREVRMRAADVLGTHGWCQNALVGPNDERCVFQAMFDVIGEQGAGQATYIANDLGFPDCSTLLAWNNTPGRTAAEVIARLLAPTAAEEAAFLVAARAASTSPLDNPAPAAVISGASQYASMETL